MFYDLAMPSWGEEEFTAIERVTKSGFFTISENVRNFEQAFAQYNSTDFAVMTNSGSSANLLSVAAFSYKKDRPLQRGDEVIVPAVSWSTMYHPLQQYGLKLRFVDVELDTLNMDVSKLEEALTDKTRMICAVSILGNPAAMDVIRDFADAHDLILMEDNCESLDAELNGKKLGTFGDIGTSSFFFSHHISTMEGGMAITNDRELADLMRSMRAHGWTRDLCPDSPVFERGTDDHYEAYRFILPGYNVRPLEFSGAIGLEQLKKLPEMTAQRRKNLSLFQELFQNDDRFIIQRENGKSSSFAFTMILAKDSGLEREQVFAALKEADIGFRIITGGCFLKHDVVKYYDYDIVGSVDNAIYAHEQGFFVGNHPNDLTPQLEKLKTVLDQI